MPPRKLRKYAVFKSGILFIKKLLRIAFCGVSGINYPLNKPPLKSHSRGSQGHCSGVHFSAHQDSAPHVSAPQIPSMVSLFSS